MWEKAKNYFKKDKNVKIFILTLVSLYVSYALLTLYIIFESFGFSEAAGINRINKETRDVIDLYLLSIYILSVSIIISLLVFYRKEISLWFKCLNTNYRMASISTSLSFITITYSLISSKFFGDLNENEKNIINVLSLLSLFLGLYWLVSKILIYWGNLKKITKNTLKLFLISMLPCIYLISDSISSKFINEIFGVPSSYLPLTQRFTNLFLSLMIIYLAINIVIALNLGYLLFNSSNKPSGSYSQKKSGFDIILNISIVVPLSISINIINEPPSSYIKYFSKFADFNISNHYKIESGVDSFIIIDPKANVALTINDDYELSTSSYNIILEK